MPMMKSGCESERKEEGRGEWKKLPGEKVFYLTIMPHLLRHHLQVQILLLAY